MALECSDVIVINDWLTWRPRIFCLELWKLIHLFISSGTFEWRANNTRGIVQLWLWPTKLSMINSMPNSESGYRIYKSGFLNCAVLLRKIPVSLMGTFRRAYARRTCDVCVTIKNNDDDKYSACCIKCFRYMYRYSMCIICALLVTYRGYTVKIDGPKDITKSGCYSKVLHLEGAFLSRYT